MIWKIVILLIFLSTIISAIEITDINCPEEISTSQDFICELDINEVNGLYDIKIQIQGGDQTINKIWNNEWQRSDWYVTRLIDQSGQYKIKLLIDKEFLGTANGLIRIRETGTKQYISENTFQLEIIETIVELVEESEESESEKHNSKTEKSKEPIKKKILPIRLNEKNTTTTISQKVINLNSDERIEETIYESKNEKIKRYSFYIFVPFLVITLILLLFKKW